MERDTLAVPAMHPGGQARRARTLREAWRTNVPASADDGEDGSLVIRSVMFDFGGVISTSPFDAFARYEEEHGLPSGLLRRINATNPEENAWARLERGELEFGSFCDEFEEEARALGGEVDAIAVIGALAGEIRPEMVAAVRHCSSRFKTACLTDNFAALEAEARPEVAEVFALFDAVFESSKLGVRKPDPEFYRMACEALDVSPREVVFLDDLGVNLKPARAMGMHTIKVTAPETAIGELFALIGAPHPRPGETAARSAPGVRSRPEQG